MKKTLIFLFVTAFCWVAFSRTNAVKSSSFITETDAQEIIDNIFRYVLGNANGTPPVIKFKGEKDVRNAVAIYFGGNSREIWVSKKAVGLLEAHYGSKAGDALAVILGHELHHAKSNLVGLNYGSTGENSEHLMAEKDADYYGLFYAYAAGYEGCLDLYDSIFEVLDIGDAKGYPGKSKRQEMNEEVIADAKNLIAQFETANWLLLLGGEMPNEFALELYEDIEKKLTGFKEIHFSKGLAALSLALEYKNAKEIYPVEVADPNFLNLRNLDEQPLNEELADRYLKKAEANFKAAIGLESEYFEARLGYACALTASKKYMEADVALAAMKGEFDKPWQSVRIDLVAAILAFKQTNGKDKDALYIIKNNADYPLMRRLAMLNLEGEKPIPDVSCPLLFLPKLDGVSDKIKDNQWLVDKVGNGKIYAQKLLTTEITCYRNSFYNFIFQEYDKLPSLPPDSEESAASLNQGAGRWRLLRCGDEEALVKLNENGKVRRCIKIIRNNK